ncbi:MAG: hypothetical protein OXQ28_05535 [Acidobacteriota bacterium]|nr:hypothetical protein [Acidobacteriota bacterium]
MVERLAKGVAIVALAGALWISPAAAHTQGECAGELGMVAAILIAQQGYYDAIGEAAKEHDIGAMIEALPHLVDAHVLMTSQMRLLASCLNE